MRFAELRQTLHRIVLAGVPALALAACDSTHPTMVYEIRQPTDPMRQALLNACAQGYTSQCEELCQQLLCDVEGYEDVLSCHIEREGDLAIVTVGYDGEVDCPVAGRRPAGLCEDRALLTGRATGVWLARAAQLEAASVHAFVALARELAHHGAPAALTRAALVAANDEIDHAVMMSGLAARYGVRARAARVEALPIRSLEAIAVENAAEGCVRETWGALLALHQSKAARDPAVRGVMERIAADELRHAALAWAVDRWVQPLLDAEARARVAAVRVTAAAALVDEAGGASPEASGELGLPDAAVAGQLLGEARAALWS